MDFPVEDFFELRIPARERVPDNDKVDVAGDVFGFVAALDANAFRGEEVAHRRIHVLIRTADIEAFAFEHRGERGHGRAADADQVDSLEVVSHWTAASSMTRRGWLLATTRQSTPSGSV